MTIMRSIGDKFNLKLKSFIEKKRMIFFRLVIFSLTFIILVLLPIVLYSGALALNFIVLGIIITSLIFISYLLRPISLPRLVVTLSIEILYIFYIVNSASVDIFEVSASSVSISVNFSYVSLLLIPVPVLAIIRSIMKYVYESKEIQYKVVILKVVLLEDLHSKTKIRKSLLKNVSINKKVKKSLLRNFNDILEELQIESPSLLNLKKGSYFITKAGENLVNNNIKINKGIVKNIIMQEVRQ
jgi:hypothetical protein